MTKLAAPLIVAAHVAHLPTLDGWTADDAAGRPAVRVFEGGVPTREDVRRWVTVGYLSGADGPAVHLEPAHTQGQNREAGSVTCELAVAAPDIATARTAAFDLLAPWSAWLAGDGTMGGRLLPGSSARLIADVDLATTRAGATARATVTITYTALTYG